MDVEIFQHAKRPYLICDMDGTLVNCGCYYKAATKKGAEHIELLTGMPAAVAKDMMEAIDLAAVKSLPPEIGFLRQRYPSSFVKALEAASGIMGTPIHEDHRQQLFAIGDDVFEAPYSPFFGAVGTVQTVANMGYGVALLTKGDHDVQMSKIVRNGFDHLFDYVNITMRKDADTLAHFLEVIGADPTQSWMVGDSLKDDIAPAHDLGLTTVFVQEHEENTWSYNHHTVKPDYIVTSVVEVLDFIPRVAVEAG